MNEPIYQPSNTEIAILKTLVYSDLFDFPLTERELHHYLMDDDASLERVQAHLRESAWLGQFTTRSNGYIALRPETPAIRHQRDEHSEALWNKSLRYGVWLAHVPFVRMVALTGALAVRNAHSADDDLDYLIVTQDGRVWLTRLMIVALVRVARLWGVQICPNYVLAEGQLAQQRRDIYIAHELAQMLPISGHALYQQMRGQNSWSQAMLPNANHAFFPIEDRTPRRVGRFLQRLAELGLRGRLGDALERWEQNRKAQKFAREAAAHQHSAAIIDPHQVKGHFHDYGHYVMQRYDANLAKYGLSYNETTAHTTPKT